MALDTSSRPGVKKHKGSRGELFVWKESPRIFVFKYDGHLTVDMVPFVRECVGTLPRPGIDKVDMFVDLYTVSGYDTDYRIEVSKWGKEVKPYLGTFALLTRSKIVAMGVAVSNLALGGFLKPFTDPNVFEKALSECVRRSSSVEVSRPGA